MKSKIFLGTDVLFYMNPTHYSPQDKQAYRSFLEFTSVQNNTRNRLKASHFHKYKHIIRTMFTKKSPLKSLSLSTSTWSTRPRASTFIGRGLISNTTPIEYVYCEDRNEMVEQLKLLMGSQLAGNNSHSNEITSIIGELREVNIIQ